MKRIKFDNLQYNWFFISLILLSLFCIIFGLFEIIEFQNPKINKGISAIGYVSQAVFFSRMFWFKNYVQYNKKGIFIRIKTFFGKSISFDNVERTELENQALTIYKNDGTRYDFNLEEIEERYSRKLFKVINQYFS